MEKAIFLGCGFTSENTKRAKSKGVYVMSKKNQNRGSGQSVLRLILSLQDKGKNVMHFEGCMYVNELLSLSQRFEVAKMLRETYLSGNRREDGRLPPQRSAV